MSPARLAALTAGLPRVAREAYAVGQEVAQGGIGRVLRARDQRLDRPVAIKELLVWDERHEQRFVREALLTARLQHPAIVPIYEAGRWPDGEPFYAMKLVSGRSLAELIAETRSFAERLALLPHVLAAAQAVAYAHSKQIIHRDLKPANVLVGEFGETVVIDWGLAKALGEAEPEGAEVDPPAGAAAGAGGDLTVDGAVVGTPWYMPPEQAAGAAVDERADVYALGAMLYHVLAAVSPYHDAAWPWVLVAITEAPPAPIERLAPALSDELAAVVNKAMARDPNERYRTAREMADDLERFQTGQIVAAHTYSAGQLLRRFWRRHRSALSVAAAALVLVAVVVLAAFLETDRGRRFAEQKEGEAVEARRVAERASAQASARADEMTLLQAQDALRRDPNRALAWLKTLSPGFADVTRVRRVAADAQARGISRAFHGHTEYVNRIDVAADGARFVTVSDDKTARVWTRATGASRALTGSLDELWNVKLTADGAEVATVGKESLLRTWDPETGALRATIEVPAPTRQLVARADGALLGANSPGGPWIRRPGAATAERLLDGAPPRWAYLADDGRRMIVQVEGEAPEVHEVEGPGRWPLPGSGRAPGRWFLDRRGEVAMLLTPEAAALWDVASGTRRDLGVGTQSRRPALSPDGSRLAFAVDADIAVVELHGGAPVRRLSGHEGPVQAVAFAGDERLVSGGVDRTVRTWDLTTGQSEVHAGFEAIVTEVEPLPDGPSVLASSATGEVREFATRRAGKVVTDHGAPATGLALAADGRVASIDERGQLRIRDLEGRTIADHAVPPASSVRLVAAPDGRTFAGVALPWIVAADGRSPDRAAPPGLLLRGGFDARAPTRAPLPAAALDLAWLPDGRAVVIGLLDGEVRRVDGDGTAATLDRLAAPVTSVAVAPDGAWIAAGGEDGAVRLTELATGRHRVLEGPKERVMTLSFSADGWLASGCADHTVRIWRLADGTARSFDEGGHGVEQVAFTADGRTLILLSGGETQLRRLDVATGDRLPPLAGPLGKLQGFTLSADGRRLLTLGADGAAMLIDLADGEGRTLAGHTEALAGAGFAAGGRVIVTLGREGTARAWPDDLPETMPALRGWIEAATPERIRER